MSSAINAVLLILNFNGQLLPYKGCFSRKEVIYRPSLMILFLGTVHGNWNLCHLNILDTIVANIISNLNKMCTEMCFGPSSQSNAVGS